MKGFLGTFPGRVVCFGVAALVILVSGANAIADLRTPREVALPSVPYTQTGHFDYSVSLKPSTLYGSAPLPDPDAVAVVDDVEPEDEEEEEEEIRHVFFRSLIDEFDMTFTYDLDVDEPLASTDIEAEVVVYATDPKVWEKDVLRFFNTQRSLPLVLDYILEEDTVENRVEDIEEDINISAGNVEYRIDGIVKVRAETVGGQVIEDTYVHSIELEIDNQQIELHEPLAYSEQVNNAPVGWAHTSRFDYDVFLKSNELFDEPVLRSSGLPVAEPEEEPVLPAETAPMQVLGPGHTYFPNLIHHVDGEFAFAFKCDSTVSDLQHDVGVTVNIVNEDTWEKTLSLVPRQTENGDFVVTFPIDLSYYKAVIDAIGEETGVRGGTHALGITATVRTTGTTGLGRINESFSQTMQCSLEKASFSVDDETLSQTVEAEVGGGTVPNEAAPPGGWRTPWLIGVAIGGLGLAYLVWREMRLRTALLSPAEVEAAGIAKKYRDMVVAVRGLPAIVEGDRIVSLRDVADLAKIADDSVKPMLHCSTNGTHSYVVLDGPIRYEYVISSVDAEQK